jgi:hypothetical protein
MMGARRRVAAEMGLADHILSYSAHGKLFQDGQTEREREREMTTSKALTEQHRSLKIILNIFLRQEQRIPFSYIFSFCPKAILQGEVQVNAYFS